MYSVAEYGQMIADDRRMSAYRRALRGAIGPSSVVLDIGAGTGICSLLACQYGARKVYAVEPGAAIAVAEEIARANGFADRMECLQAVATEISLPERADIIVSDLRGTLPLFEEHLPAIIDARRRLLAPGGTLIPARDTMWAALVEAPRNYHRLIEPWARERFNLDMEAAAQIVTNGWTKARFAEDELLSKPECWAVLDYLTVQDVNAARELTFQVERTGTGHGFVLWFDAVLVDGVELSNAPGQPEGIYGSGFFPWSSPVALTEGQRVSIDLRADMTAGDYVWSWETRVSEADAGRPAVHFRQSTFFGAPLSTAQLQKRAGRYRPTLKEDGEIDRQIFGLMDGSRSNQDIAQLMVSRFPMRFQSEQDALTRIADMAEKYSQ
jgi:protein arginine N-methyltransferase 1